MSAAKSNLEVLPRGVQVALVLGLIALAAFPFTGTDFYVQMVTRMMIMAIFAMSLDLLQGVTGLVSLGHAAYFGLAGYALAFLTPQGEAVSLWWTLPLAVLASGLAALIKSKNPRWTPAQVKKAIERSSVPLGKAFSSSSGHGRIDAAGALQ